MMKTTWLLMTLCLALGSCAQGNSQKGGKDNPTYRNVGGPCEGCEAIHESPVPFDQLNAVDTLPDFGEEGPKLEISGVVYRQDGRTPAPNVILYVYHTDQKGVYPTRGGEKGWGRRHGYLRGWVRTDAQGRYRFYTLRPAPYPGAERFPAHIHVIVREPDKNEYWIDDFHFDDDPALPPEERARLQNRGGNGILKVEQKGGRGHAVRDIILGQNIPGYPSGKKDHKISSSWPAWSLARLFAI